jgi:hypothetical protein
MNRYEHGNRQYKSIDLYLTKGISGVKWWLERYVKLSSVNFISINMWINE